MTNFYTDGGNKETTIPTFGPYLPCIMKQLASVTVVEYSPPYDLGTIIQRSQRWLDDALPEVVEASMGEELYGNIRRLEGKAYMVGREWNEPQGVFTSERIQRLKATLGSDAIITLIYALTAQHRASAAFLCSENTVRTLKRLKDGDGRFIFEHAVAAGVPDRMLGYPLYVDPDAPDKQLMFGNFREGYNIDSRPFITILRDPFSQKPHVLFHATHKTGGEVKDEEALRILEWEHAEETY